MADMIDPSRNMHAMEDEASVHQQVQMVREPIRLTAKQRQLMLDAERALVAAVISEHAAVLHDAGCPSTRLDLLPHMVQDRPRPHLMEPQPIILAGIAGGTTPGRGRVMLDTGAGLSLVTMAVCRAHGLRVHPYHATFATAGGQHAKICGMVDLEMIVHNGLSLSLKGVKV